MKFLVPQSETSKSSKNNLPSISINTNMSSRTSALIAPLLLFFWLAGELRDEAAVGRASAGTASVSLRDGESEPDSLREDDFISDISYRHQGYSWKPSDFGTLVLCLDYCIRLQVYDSMEFSSCGDHLGGANNSGCDDGGESQSGSSSATGVVVLSTLVAVSGSYVFGTAVGYSSPAQSGIMDDLGLTVAEGAWWLDLGRLLVGCGMGLLSYVVPIYLAEITPKNHQVGFTIVHQVRQKSHEYGNCVSHCPDSLVYLLIATHIVNDLLWRIVYISNWSFCELANFGSNWNITMSSTTSWSILHSRISKMAGFSGSIGTIAMVIVQH
uniref:Major facilitator superfamily (MFS) profile domain-containing protein n=1 Tax=Quercus lobata TaxID=97700 RepID=A0A7N2LAP8_QUELO